MTIFKFTLYCIVLFIAYLSMTSASKSKSLTFYLIAPNSTSAKVTVLGFTYDLFNIIPGLPYYNTSVPDLTSDNLNYYYTVDGVAEPFDRLFPQGKKSTYNDFFMRNQTIDNLVQLGWPFTDRQHWNRSLGPNGVFDDDYISTVFFLGEAALDLFANPIHGPSGTGITVAIINRSNFGYFTNVSVTGQNGDEIRMGLHLKLPNNYRKRSTYKLRPSSFDPIFFREKIYNDVLEAIGCPHQETSFTRVYVEDKGLGFYHLQEDVATKDFVKTQFYGESVLEPTEIGIPLLANTGADFYPEVSLYNFQPPTGETPDRVMSMIDALASLDVLDAEAVAYFEANWFDIEMFFRAVAMEYLAGHWDSYWWFTTNYMVYDDPTEGLPTTYKFYFVDQDFDQTFGVDLSPPYNEYGDNFTEIPYTAFVNITWSLSPIDAPHRTMIDKLLSSSALVARFENILKTIVSGVFNPIALERRISAVANRIRPDIYWDRNLGVNRARQPNTTYYLYTPEDFDNGFTEEIFGNYGFYTWISDRSNFIANYYGISFIDPPLNPPNTTSGGDPSGNGGGDSNSNGDQGSYITGGSEGGITTVSSGYANTNLYYNDATKSAISTFMIAVIVLVILAGF